MLPSSIDLGAFNRVRRQTTETRVLVHQAWSVLSAARHFLITGKDSAKEIRKAVGVVVADLEAGFSIDGYKVLGLYSGVLWRDMFNAGFRGGLARSIIRLHCWLLEHYLSDTPEARSRFDRFIPDYHYHFWLMTGDRDSIAELYFAAVTESAGTKQAREIVERARETYADFSDTLCHLERLYRRPVVGSPS